MEDTRCVQKANALTLLIQTAYAMAGMSERSRLDSYVLTYGTITGVVRMHLP